jgi:hypothetical protein
MLFEKENIILCIIVMKLSMKISSSFIIYVNLYTFYRKKNNTNVKYHMAISIIFKFDALFIT